MKRARPRTHRGQRATDLNDGTAQLTDVFVRLALVTVAGLPCHPCDRILMRTSVAICKVTYLKSGFGGIIEADAGYVGFAWRLPAVFTLHAGLRKGGL